MPIYSIAIIQFDEISPSISTTDSVGSSVANQTYTISTSAVPIAIQVDDDDADFDDGFIDPPGNSTSANNQLIAEPVTIIGVTYGPSTSGGAPQDQIELEFAFTTSDGDTFYVVRINGTNVGLSGPTLPQPGQVFTVDTVSDGVDTPYDQIPCFADGTMIRTPNGEVAVESLKAGDLVATVDAGLKPLVRVMSCHLSARALKARRNLRPIVFQAGSVGNAREMRLSPQHRLLASGWMAELHFGEPQVLIPARACVNGTTVTVERPTRDVRYFHLLFEDHQLVYSDGAITESLYPGHNVARPAHPAGLKELGALFGPALRARDTAILVRPMVPTHEASLLANAMLGAGNGATR
jgi:hypothetical protein